MNLLQRFLCLALILSSPLLLAKEKATTWKTEDDTNLLLIIPPPPSPGSAAERADLNGVLALQNNPAPEVVAHAETSVAFNLFSFSSILGPDFTPETHPQTVDFFKRLEDTVNKSKNFLKETYRRARPYKAFPDQVRELVTVEQGYSYPSGHSTRSWLYALVLGTLDPGHRKDFLSYAMQVCQDRIIGGMHYPSDVLESRVLAEEIFQDLLDNKEFMSDLAALHKAEWMEKSNLK